MATTSPLDTATGASASSTAPSSGTTTPTVPGDLAVGLHRGPRQQAGHHRHGRRLHRLATTDQRGARTWPAWWPAYRTVSTVTAQTFTGHAGTAMYWAAGVAMFKPATAATERLLDQCHAERGEVIAGHATTFTVSTAVTSGVSQQVVVERDRTARRRERDASPRPPSLPATARRMTLSSSVSTSPGTTSLTVVGTGTDCRASTSLSLTVTTPVGDPRGVLLPVVPGRLDAAGAEPVHQLRPDPRLLRTDVATVSAQIADMQYAGVHTRHRVVVRADLQHREALAGDHAGRPQGTGFAWAPVLREGVDVRSDASADRRRPALPTQHVRRTRVGARVAARQGHAGLRLQLRRSDQRQGLRHRQPLEPGPSATAAGVRRVDLHRSQGLPAVLDLSRQRRDQRLAPVRAGQRPAELLDRAR